MYLSLSKLLVKLTQTVVALKTYTHIYIYIFACICSWVCIYLWQYCSFECFDCFCFCLTKNHAIACDLELKSERRPDAKVQRGETQKLLGNAASLWKLHKHRVCCTALLWTTTKTTAVGACIFHGRHVNAGAHKTNTSVCVCEYVCRCMCMHLGVNVFNR